MKEPRHRKDNRRPDLEIYKPGLSRLRGKPGPAKQQLPAEEEAEEEGLGPGKPAAAPCREDTPLPQGPPEDKGQPPNGFLEGPPQGPGGSPQDWCPRIVRRAKKPDQQIYQPGKRLQASPREAGAAPLADEELSPKDCEKDAGRAGQGPGKPGGPEGGPSQEGARPFRGEKGRRAERPRKAREEPGHGKGSPPKRYSRSDKRRSRYRTCSTSSAGSNNSTEGACGEAEVGRKPPERPHPQKQLSASSTDSLEEDRAEEGPEARRAPEHSRLARGQEARAAQGGGWPAGRGSTASHPDWRKGGKPSGATSRDPAEAGEGKPQNRGRGILVLPANTDLTPSGTGSPEAPHGGGARLLFGSGKGPRSWSRGGTSRRLWDPNNPEQKPALKSPGTQLHFLDTDDEGAPVPRGEPRQAQAPYYRFQNSDNPYYYGGAPYPYAGYPLPYPVGPGSEVYPAAYYPTGYPKQAEPCGAGGAGGALPADPPGPEAEQQKCHLQQQQQQQQQELGKALREAGHLEQQLSNLLSRDRLSPEGLEKMGKLRAEMLQLYELCLLTDIEVADAQNVDQLLWKNAFYQVIEKFRQLLKDPAGGDGTQEIRGKLLQILDEGTVFFDGLLQKLQATYQFKLEDYMDSMAVRTKPLRKTVKYALISAQRSLICQGDICRYREQGSDTANYGKARSWYLKAQHVAPKNGRPYNQLALLAVYTRRKLDAVYYYMRSLAASNPILTAKESLTSLFEETKRKAEQLEQKSPRGQGSQRSRKAAFRPSGDDATRLELWIHPSHPRSGQGHEPSRDSGQDSGLGSLSPSELNKRFVLRFLQAHGKLFTRIGMETFPAVAAEVLTTFQALLEHSPPPIGSSRLLQLMAINMFAVHNSQPKAVPVGSRSFDPGRQVPGFLCRETPRPHPALEGGAPSSQRAPRGWGGARPVLGLWLLLRQPLALVGIRQRGRGSCPEEGVPGRPCKSPRRGRQPCPPPLREQPAEIWAAGALARQGGGGSLSSDHKCVENVPLVGWLDKDVAKGPGRRGPALFPCGQRILAFSSCRAAGMGAMLPSRRSRWTGSQVAFEAELLCGSGALQTASSCSRWGDLAEGSPGAFSPLLLAPLGQMARAPCGSQPGEKEIARGRRLALTGTVVEEGSLGARGEEEEEEIREAPPCPESQHEGCRSQRRGSGGVLALLVDPGPFGKGCPEPLLD
ncbi:telomerase-binding protein EST1A-like [Crotalus adamanteus]|uniref:Nonsense-mediated mRNA decay factor n=1 Tax=Crotalus adamanteus TaxID=8729 RepID=A0AAW1CJ14_CROAD